MRDASAVLLVLVLASMLLDFGLSSWRERRGRPFGTGVKLAFALLQGATVMLILWAFGLSILTALTSGAAFVLASGMSRLVAEKWASKLGFIVQPALQLLSLITIWLTAQGYWHWAGESASHWFDTQHLLVLLAYILVWRPCSKLIGAVLTPFLDKGRDEDSLKKAGTWIGYLERTLILTFVLLDQWEAIGFLLTAKSILRFNDIKDAKQRSLSEYVLLGTLVSVTVSIAIGLAVLKLTGK